MSATGHRGNVVAKVRRWYANQLKPVYGGEPSAGRGVVCQSSNGVQQFCQRQPSVKVITVSCKVLYAVYGEAC